MKKKNFFTNTYEKIVQNISSFYQNLKNISSLKSIMPKILQIHSHRTKGYQNTKVKKENSL